MSSRTLIDLGVSPVIPVITFHDLSHVSPLITTLAEAGLTTCEITLRSDIGLEAIKLASSLGPEVCVGAGTVTSHEQASAAVSAGAKFLVSPGFSSDLVSSTQHLDSPLIPGIATASELQHAISCDISTVKVFPIEHVGGIGLIKSFAAVWPQMKFLPTGGISLDTAASYLQHPSVIAVGGSWMIPSDALERKDWEAIALLARQASQLRR